MSQGVAIDRHGGIKAGFGQSILCLDQKCTSHILYRLEDVATHGQITGIRGPVCAAEKSSCPVVRLAGSHMVLGVRSTYMEMMWKHPSDDRIFHEYQKTGFSFFHHTASEGKVGGKGFRWLIQFKVDEKSDGNTILQHTYPPRGHLMKPITP